jgi:Putative restriction endonuclease
VATALEIPRKVWTRADAHTLADSGLFPNASKLELINGDLIDHTGKKRPHAIWQKLILVWLQATFGTEYVEMENPIDVAAADNLLNEPEPDLMVTVKNSREYATNPTPEELRLVIEVSDSTVNFDLKVKGRFMHGRESWSTGLWTSRTGWCMFTALPCRVSMQAC